MRLHDPHVFVPQATVRKHDALAPAWDDALRQIAQLAAPPPAPLELQD